LQTWHDLRLAVIEGTMLRLRPLAMTFTGAAFQESRLIRLAYAFETAARARRNPEKPRLTEE
jgi:Asp-tRNA(Asn)/Glu-tRNA(Gln) amidotransferase A subunit family amidase